MAEKSIRDVLEVLTAILLGLVSVATAFGAYHASEWTKQAADYRSVSQQLRDRNLSETLTTQLIFADDGAKILDLIGLDSEALLFPDRADEVLAQQEVMLSSMSPELADAWVEWINSGQDPERLPLSDPDYEAALFAETQSMHYASYIADQLSDEVGAKGSSITIASVIFALALFLLGVAGVNTSWKIAAALGSGAAIAFLSGVLVTLFAIY